MGTDSTPLDYFRELSKIPRVSGNEKAAADFVQRVSESAGCHVYRDAMHNLIVTKPGSPGCEDAPAFMLQGHLDMVAEADPGVNHDFAVDPICLVEEDGILRAKGTTLGADDGIAVAIMLRVLTDEHIVHPPLECVFTVQEETGLYGAMALDASRLKARRMLNLDAGPEGIFVASCAGGCRVSLERPLTWKETSQPMWQIEISGLEGGHSGGAISRQGGNALVICGILLDAIMQAGGCAGCVHGGDKDNVIPNRAEADFSFEGDPDAILESVKQKILETWLPTDANLQIKWHPSDANRVLSAEDGEALVSLLRLLPHGVFSRSPQMPDVPESSANLASVHTNEDLCIGLSLRSSSDFRKEMLIRQVEKLAKIFGASCRFSGVYPGWRYAPESKLRDVARQAFETVYGYTPQIQGIHAGLECGVLKRAIPDLDIIATGPKYGAMHTTSEWMDIASVTQIYEFVKELLRHFTQ